MNTLSSQLEQYDWPKESQWIVLALALPLVWSYIWMPVRDMLNRWRLANHLKKYPYAIVVQQTAAQRKKVKESAWIWMVAERIMSLASLLFVNTFAGIALAVFYAVSNVKTMGKSVYNATCQLATRAWTSIRPKPEMQEPTSPRSSSSSYSAPPSVLRQQKQRNTSPIFNDGPSKSVVFAEHSDGQIRTLSYYYNPQGEPDQRAPENTSSTPPRPKDGIPTTPLARRKIQRRQQTPPAVRRRPAAG